MLIQVLKCFEIMIIATNAAKESVRTVTQFVAREFRRSVCFKGASIEITFESVRTMTQFMSREFRRSVCFKGASIEITLESVRTVT